MPDIYADLEGQQHADADSLRMRLKELTDRNAAQDIIVERLEKEVQALRKENESLQKEKDILAYNISSLFNTAKMEIERKDNEIKDLREQLNQATSVSANVQGRSSEANERNRERGSRGGHVPDTRRDRNQSRERPL